MVEATCHCGAVRIEVESAPTVLTSCNCSICRRLGTLWMYDSPSRVRVVGSTATYAWGERSLDLHRCLTCGCTTHWTLADPAGDRMGVNARLLEPAVIAGVRIRRFDGADTWKFLDEA